MVLSVSRSSVNREVAGLNPIWDDVQASVFFFSRALLARSVEHDILNLRVAHTSCIFIKQHQKH